MIKTNPIEDKLEDLVSNFLYYDRKDDEDLPLGAIEKAIYQGDTGVKELTTIFEQALRRGLK